MALELSLEGYGSSQRFSDCSRLVIKSVGSISSVVSAPMLDAPSCQWNGDDLFGLVLLREVPALMFERLSA